MEATGNGRKSSKRQARIGRQARTAELTLRYRRVEIARDPKVRQAALETFSLIVVYAVEQAPPRGETPIEWFVLTTLSVSGRYRACSRGARCGPDRHRQSCAQRLRAFRQNLY